VEQILTNLPVLAVDLEVSRAHARIWADLQLRGTTIGAHDLLIAATAIQHDLTIATRNLRAFLRVESLRVEQW
jgi:predicted nucleic acid-binding protein